MVPVPLLWDAMVPPYHDAKGGVVMPKNFDPYPYMTHVFKDVLGECAEVCSHGGTCSLLAEHPGLHETHGPRGTVHCRWES